MLPLRRREREKQERAFAVVAEEIGQLAGSTRETANRIQDINAVVTGAVHNLAEHANSLVTYMNDVILPGNLKTLSRRVDSIKMTPPILKT